MADTAWLGLCALSFILGALCGGLMARCSNRASAQLPREGYGAFTDPESVGATTEARPSVVDRVRRFFESLFSSGVDLAMIVAAVIVLVFWWWLMYELELFP